MSDASTKDAGILARLRPELAGLKAYTVPKKAPAVKLDANESPFPLPPHVQEELAGSVAKLSFHRYPDGSAGELRQALANYLSSSASVDASRLLLGVGSDEIITILMNAFGGAHNGERATVVFPAPTFVMYDVTARAQGLRPYAVPLGDDFLFDEAAFAAALESKPALAFYATPNNPTGRSIEDSALRRLIEAFPTTLHVLDEAYGPFERSAEGGVKTRRSWADEYPQVAVMGTLSKVGLAALRVGYLYAGAPLLGELQKVRQPFNLNLPAQAIATHLLTHHASLLRSHIAQVVCERARMFSALSDRTPIPSQANFHLLRMSADEGKALRENGIGVRIFKDEALRGWARITVGTPEENDALLRALKQL